MDRGFDPSSELRIILRRVENMLSNGNPGRAERPEDQSMDRSPLSSFNT